MISKEEEEVVKNGASEFEEDFFSFNSIYSKEKRKKPRIFFPMQFRKWRKKSWNNFRLERERKKKFRFFFNVVVKFLSWWSARFIFAVKRAAALKTTSMIIEEVTPGPNAVKSSFALEILNIDISH